MRIHSSCLPSVWIERRSRIANILHTMRIPDPRCMSRHLKLSQMWFSDPRIESLERYDNHDRTRPGDFGFAYRGTPITVQVKSLQSNQVRRTESGYSGTFQCDASDRRPVILPNGETVETTCLVVGGFDLVAVNLFQFGQQWRFAFAKNEDLPTSRSNRYTPDRRKHLLATSVKITWPLQPPFRDEPFQVLDEIVTPKPN